jgi:type II secretory pathway component PulF
VFVVPRFMGIFSQVRVPLPGLTLLFMNVSNALRSTAGIAGIALFFAGLLVLRWKRIRVPRPVYQTILIGSVVLCFGMLISLFLPLVTLLEGIGMRR